MRRRQEPLDEDPRSGSRAGDASEGAERDRDPGVGFGAEADRSRSRRYATSALSTLTWIFVGLSPLVFYFAVRSSRIEEAALVLVGFAILRAIPAVLAARREHLVHALQLPVVAVISAGAGWLLHEPRALLVLPSASQMMFGAVFLVSLRKVPLVENFARMQKSTLSEAERTYCRTVTLVWGLALCSAALFGLALAAWASLELWTAFTGVGSYVLVATLFSVEYVVRKVRFREYGTSMVDRLLSRVIPPREYSARTLQLGPDEGGQTDVTIPADYVFFGGHFETAPILPGVVQLTEVVLPVVRRRHPELGALKELRRVRFRRPIFPGETVRVRVSDVPVNASRIDFKLVVDAKPVASGVMSFDIRPK